MNISKYLNNELFIKVGLSFLLVLVSIVVYNIFVMIIGSSINRGGFGKLSVKKKATYLKMLKSIIRYVLIVIDVLVVFRIFGINITSMLAGVGIIGIILGFAVQDALKDIIKGIDIIADNYYQVGDVIKYNGIVGKVISIGLKTTKSPALGCVLGLLQLSSNQVPLPAFIESLTRLSAYADFEIRFLALPS